VPFVVPNDVLMMMPGSPGFSQERCASTSSSRNSHELSISRLGFVHRRSLVSEDRAEVQFAALDAGLGVTADDFWIV
jgi:hypothetical protein